MCLLLHSVLLLWALVPDPGAASELMLHYDFNGSDPKVVSDRSGNGTDAFMIGIGDNTARSAAGEGVSGNVTDRCFDNRAATGMGSRGRGGAVRSDRFAPGTLDSFTITGWFATEGNVWLDQLARLVEIKGRPGLSLMAVNGQLLLKIGDSGFLSAAAYHETSRWLFFAVSYDGTAPAVSDNVRFFVGSKEAPVRLVNQGSLLPPLGPWNGPATASVIAWGNSVGGRGPGDRPVDGRLDDLRFYGAAEGSGGALDQVRLEDIRRSALADNRK